jgi:hypothetical protein
MAGKGADRENRAAGMNKRSEKVAAIAPRLRPVAHDAENRRADLTHLNARETRARDFLTRHANTLERTPAP